MGVSFLQNSKGKKWDQTWVTHDCARSCSPLLQGDHVKVVGGRKAGVTGTVVRVEGEVIYLLTDITNDEIRVFSADLQETNEVSSGLDVVGQFRLYDLVLLESAGVSMTMPSVGVIIKLERDALQILDNNNKIQAKRPSDVTLHRKSATAVALDSEQQTIGTCAHPSGTQIGTRCPNLRPFSDQPSAPERRDVPACFCCRPRSAATFPDPSFHACVRRARRRHQVHRWAIQGKERDCEACVSRLPIHLLPHQARAERYVLR
jgi:hypothetical protein